MEYLNGQTRTMFEESAFRSQADISGGSRLSYGRTVSPPVSPSQHVPSRLPNIYDQIIEYFNGVIGKRKLVASTVTAGLSAVYFVLTSLILQISLTSPIASFSEMANNLFSVPFWSSTVFVWFLSFIALFVIAMVLAKPDQPRVSVLQPQGWICFLTLSSSLIASVLIVCAFSDLTFSWPLLLFVLTFTCGSVILRQDFRLFFIDHSKRGDISPSLRECLALAGDSPILYATRETLTVYRLSLCLGLILTFTLRMLSDGVLAALAAVFPLALSPSLHLRFLIFTFWPIYLVRCSIRVMKEIVMNPMSFPLPPPYAIRSPTPQQTRTLVNVIESPDLLLKLFAFTDLCRIAWGDPSKRQEIFSLSQPGGHPRNWMAICAATLRVINNTKAKLDQATSAMGGRDDVEEEEELPDKHVRFMPERIRQQVLSSGIRNRHRAALMSTVQNPRTRPPPTFLQKTRKWLDNPNPPVTRYESSLVQLAVESLCQLACYSLDEDRYGVVQKDLPSILSSFVQLVATIDRHFRARGARMTTNEEDVPLKQMITSLHTALFRVKHKFQPHLGSLGLSPEVLRALETME